jgi:hypothetical protein
MAGQFTSIRLLDHIAVYWQQYPNYQMNFALLQASQTFWNVGD